MPKFTAQEWDDIRKKFKNSIMADTSLVSLAQNLDTQEWPVKGEDEKPSKYIEFNYDELLMMPEIAGKTDRADHLIGILKETLAFDDPFGDMVAQVEETAAKENPILKTLARLEIPEAFPLSLANLSEGTMAVCSSEGVKTIGEFANLAQSMSTRVVIGGDFRALLNALSHGDELGIGQFLPFRKGALGLHLPEALGLAVARLSRGDQVALAKAYGARIPTADAASAKTLSPEQKTKLENGLRAQFTAVFLWFSPQKKAMIDQLNGGTTLERYLVVINDPVREAVVAKIAGEMVKSEVKAPVETSAAADEGEKKGGFFSRLFGRG
jgi:hypothetical protein